MLIKKIKIDHRIKNEFFIGSWGFTVEQVDTPMLIGRVFRRVLTLSSEILHASWFGSQFHRWHQNLCAHEIGFWLLDLGFFTSDR